MPGKNLGAGQRTNTTSANITPGFIIKTESKVTKRYQTIQQQGFCSQFYYQATDIRVSQHLVALSTCPLLLHTSGGPLAAEDGTSPPYSCIFQVLSVKILTTEILDGLDSTTGVLSQGHLRYNLGRFVDICRITRKPISRVGRKGVKISLTPTSRKIINNIAI